MRKSFSDHLVATKVVTQDQLTECLADAQTSGRSLDECLLEREFTTAAKIAEAYAEYTALPFVESITEKMTEPALLGKVPLKFLRDNTVMPIVYDDQHAIATANPLNYQPVDELNMLLGGNLISVVAPSLIIIDAINRFYPIEGAKQMIEELEEEADISGEVDFSEIDEKDILSVATEAPIIKLVNHIFLQAVKRDASDIHIEPFEKELRVRYRVDGAMYNVMSPPKRVQGALISRIKIMAHLDIAEKRVPQDGRIQIKVAEKAIDIRVSVLPVAHGERIVMRLLDKSRSFGKLNELGMSERDFEVVMRAIERPNGIIYVTGPTGSGKTTTLYSVLSALNNPDVNIITVEDPIEYQIVGVGQVQVKEKVGMTFASALRSILRQDPDIIMIGETRDQETARIAVQAALTGHLVLTTLHTNSAPAAITRLIDMEVEPFLIASSVIVILAQRLVRKLCDLCKESYTPSDETLSRFNLDQKKIEGMTFYKAADGCEQCTNTGYKGRLAIFEVMEMTDNITRATMERVDASVIKKNAIKDGMTPLIQDGLRKVKMGLTTLEEVLSVATVEHAVPQEGAE